MSGELAQRKHDGLKTRQGPAGMVIIPLYRNEILCLWRSYSGGCVTAEHVHKTDKEPLRTGH